MERRILALSTENRRTQIVIYAGRPSSGAPIGRRSVLNDTARCSNRLHSRHLVDRHMGRDGTSTLAVAPRGHYCGGGYIGHCRVVNESPTIKPGIPVTSSANDLGMRPSICRFTLARHLVVAFLEEWLLVAGQQPLDIGGSLLQS